jgi:uncharacterized cofD-like protein
MAKRLKDLKVVAIGGGTGLSTMLKGLKQYTSNVTAVVTVSDNGGASGILRQEMNMMPPGDIRNCLVALANTEPVMEELLQYRFKEGGLKGQNFGNLLLAALCDVAGNFEQAVQVTSNVLAITGKVLPVTTQNVQLYGIFEDGVAIEGECQIVEYSKEKNVLLNNIALIPENPEPATEVLDALREADLILLGPGSLYTSIIPNLLVKDVSNEIKNAAAKKIYVANIMSQPGETTGFSIEDHIRAIEKYIGDIGCALINNAEIPKEYMEKYAEEGAHLLTYSKEDSLWSRTHKIEAPLAKIDHQKRYIRHDPNKLAEYIFANIQ